MEILTTRPDVPEGLIIWCYQQLVSGVPPARRPVPSFRILPAIVISV